MQNLVIEHRFSQPVATVFATLADHNQLSKVFLVPVKRIQNGSPDVNGLGSVRQIGMGPLAVEETVTGYVANQTIDYCITKGGAPIRNHRGRVDFVSNADGGCTVRWNIQFDASIPLADFPIGKALQFAVSQGLKRLF